MEGAPRRDRPDVGTLRSLESHPVRRHRGRHRRLLLSMFALLPAASVLLPRPATAVEVTLPGSLAPLEVHGFVSQGFLLTSANNYLANSSRGSFEFSEVGLNFPLPATERLRLGIQLFSRDLGPIGDYRATLDWYYLDYHWR